MQYRFGSKNVNMMLASSGLMPSSVAKQFIRYMSSPCGRHRTWLVMRATFSGSFRATNSSPRCSFSGSSLNFHSTIEPKSAQLKTLFLRNFAPNSLSRCACEPKALSYLRLHIKKSALSTEFTVYAKSIVGVAFLLFFAAPANRGTPLQVSDRSALICANGFLSEQIAYTVSDCVKTQIGIRKLLQICVE